MRIRGVGRAKLIAKWARTQFGSPGALILGYHRIAQSSWDPQQLCVSPHIFEEHLDVLTRLTRPISLQQFVSNLISGDDIKRSVVVTFDDGYADTLSIGLPLLEKYGVPATVFVPTGMIDKPFWWCAIQEVVEDAPDLPDEFEIEVGGDRFQWERRQKNSGDRAAVVHSLCVYFRSLPVPRIEEALNRLRAVFDVPARDKSSAWAMGRVQISELAKSELIDIGSHTVTHASLNGLSAEEQKVELCQSKLELEDITGRHVSSFSYPNGAVSRNAPGILSELGFNCGVTSNVRPVTRRDDPFLLPRPFVGNWDGDQFSRWLVRWLR